MPRSPVLYPCLALALLVGCPADEDDDDDGRFDATLYPVYDQSNVLDLGVYYTDMIKVLGVASGTMELDDGTVIEFEDMLASAEHAWQKW